MLLLVTGYTLKKSHQQMNKCHDRQGSLPTSSCIFYTFTCILTYCNHAFTVSCCFSTSISTKCCKAIPNCTVTVSIEQMEYKSSLDWLRIWRRKITMVVEEELLIISCQTASSLLIRYMLHSCSSVKCKSLTILRRHVTVEFLQGFHYMSVHVCFQQ